MVSAAFQLLLLLASDTLEDTRQNTVVTDVFTLFLIGGQER